MKTTILIIEDNSGIVIKSDIGAIWTMILLSCSHNHRLDHITLLHHAQFLSRYGLDILGIGPEEGYFFPEFAILSGGLSVVFFENLEFLFENVIVHESVVSEHDEKSHQEEKTDHVLAGFHNTDPSNQKLKSL